jgi:hypothetical protein
MKRKVDLLLEAATEVTGFSFDRIKSRNRAEMLVFTRKIIACHMIREQYAEALIANIVGLSRSNIIGMKRKFNDEYNPKYRKLFDERTEAYN